MYQLILSLVAGFGELLLFQTDFVDGAAKWTGIIMFAFVAIAAIVSAAYSVFKAQKTKDLQARIDGLRGTLDDERKSNADLLVRLASAKAETVLAVAEQQRLKRKLKDERKITLAQAAALGGVQLPEDHYDDE